jgi:hypothetical protein
VTLSLARSTVFALGLMGCLLFASAFVASIVNPGLVEGFAKDLIRHQVEKKVREKIASLDYGFLARRAESYSKSYGEGISLAKRQLSDQLPARIAAVIAEMTDLNCECRKKIEVSLREGLEWRVASASQAQERLATLIRAKYMETAGHLTREFRIFTGTNALVFALLVAAVFVKRRAGWHLFPLAVVLVGAASITAYIYLFNQNWLHTLVFSDYVGFTYLTYLAVVFVCLYDVIFNRARVTARLMTGVLDAIGSTMVVVPC